MSIGVICSRVVDTAAADEMVADVAARMRESNVGSLPVVDAEARVVGIVTDRDLVTRVLAQRRDGQHTRVAEILSACPQTVREDASIEDALAIMRRRSLRRLPVVDAGNKLVGIVTLDDILAVLAQEFGAIGSVLAAELPRKVTAGILTAPPAATVATQSRPRPAAVAPRAAASPPADESTLAGAASLTTLLAQIRQSIDVIACALSLGLERRMLGGGVIEADVRAAADRRLREILSRSVAP